MSVEVSLVYMASGVFLLHNNNKDSNVSSNSFFTMTEGTGYKGSPVQRRSASCSGQIWNSVHTRKLLHDPFWAPSRLTMQTRNYLENLTVPPSGVPGSWRTSHTARRAMVSRRSIRPSQKLKPPSCQSRPALGWTPLGNVGVPRAPQAFTWDACSFQCGDSSPPVPPGSQHTPRKVQEPAPESRRTSHFRDGGPRGSRRVARSQTSASVARPPRQVGRARAAPLPACEAVTMGAARAAPGGSWQASAAPLHGRSPAQPALCEDPGGPRPSAAGAGGGRPSWDVRAAPLRRSMWSGDGFERGASLSAGRHGHDGRALRGGSWGSAGGGGGGAGTDARPRSGRRGRGVGGGSPGWASRVLRADPRAERGTGGHRSRGSRRPVPVDGPAGWKWHREPAGLPYRLKAWRMF